MNSAISDGHFYQFDEGTQRQGRFLPSRGSFRQRHTQAAAQKRSELNTHTKIIK